MSTKTSVSFASLSPADFILQYVNEKKLTTPTAIQKLVFKSLAEGKSLWALGPTGSGKTLAFVLPLMQRLKKMESEWGRPINGQVRLVVLAPTKELAHQLFEVIKTVSHLAKCTVRESIGKQKKVLMQENEGIDILVTVPNRLQKLLSSGEINAQSLLSLAIDEADQVVDSSFKDDLQKIGRHIGQDTQVVFISATHSVETEVLQKTFFPREEMPLMATAIDTLSMQFETFNIYCKPEEKKTFLYQLLEKAVAGNGIIFVNRKESAEEVYEWLSKERPKHFSPQIKFFMLHGEIAGDERLKCLKAFKELGGILICTDIFARGMDIAHVKWCLNYELPFEAVYYLHRSGRVGRSGAHGVIYNFVTHLDSNLIGRINEAIKNQTALKLKPIKSMATKTQKNSKKVAGKEEVEKSQENQPRRRTNRVVLAKEKGKIVAKKVKRTPRFARIKTTTGKAKNKKG